MLKKTITSLIVLNLLILIAIGHAGVTGKIAGRLTDREAGDPLPGGNVFVRGMIQNGQEIRFSVENIKGTATDLNGEFFIINLHPGLYVVEASYMGYNSQVRKDVKVAADYTARVDFQLSQSALELGEEVVVTAERELIRKDLTSSAVSISSEELLSLPVREVGEVLELQAGVVRDAGGQLHIRGGRSNEILYMIDGMQVLDPLNRTSGLRIDNQSIQELQAITGTFNAEYGQALSGVINIVTRQGSDKFRFNLSAYLGDHLSFDDNTYYIMNNNQWAKMAAHVLTNQLFEEDMEYVLSGKYNFDSPELARNKSYLEKTGYFKKYNPFSDRDLQFNMSGPIPLTRKKVTYFFSGRYQDSPGNDYGKRYFMPWGFSSPALDTVNSYKVADNALVPLSWTESFSSQSKLFYRPIPSMNFSYGFYFEKRDNRDGNNFYKYVPDATIIHHNTSQTHIIDLNHALSSKTFYEFKMSYYQKDYKGNLYDSPYDYRYVPTQRADFEQYVYNRKDNNFIQVSLNNSDFTYFGNEVDRSTNNVKNLVFKYDLTSQVTKRHMMKFGLGLTLHDLKNEWYQLQFDQKTYRPYIPDSDSSAFYQNYHHKPIEFAGYIQDKIEFKELIINFGIRFDYFDSDGKLLTDPADPEINDPAKPEHRYKNYDPSKPRSEWGEEFSYAERQKFWFTKVKPKYQLSPRVGISFPITEKGVIHFAYGHFFQNPELRYLYENPKFWVDITKAGVTPRIGNADIDAERTVSYEVGIQQGLWDNVFIHATGFYRDIRDWVGISPGIDTYWGTTYNKYINNDHASVKGFTLTNRLLLSNFSVNMDYTFQIVKGTYSNPADAYNKIRAEEEPRRQLISLDWDQRHTINLTFTYAHSGWNSSLIGSLSSGFPYTPSFARGETFGSSTTSGLRENSEFRPTTYNLDLRISRRVNFFNYYTDIFLNVFNLLDTRNPRTVYSDTGRPDYTFEGFNQADRNRGVDLEISDVDEYYMRAGNYYPPRFIQFGMSVGL